MLVIEACVRSKRQRLLKEPCDSDRQRTVLNLQFGLAELAELIIFIFTFLGTRPRAHPCVIKRLSAPRLRAHLRVVKRF